MTQALYTVALLACPVGMGLMMWFMMRGGKNASPAAPAQSTNDGEPAHPRAEAEQLRATPRDRRDDLGVHAAGAHPR